MPHRPLRVQFVLTSLPVGGAETLLLNLVREMDRHNFAPEVVCLKEPGALGDEFAKLVPVHSHFIRHKFDMAVVLRLKRLFARRHTDAVITVGAGDKMFWGRLAARMAGVPVICSALHSTGWPDGVGKLNRLLTPITDGFIAVAPPHAQHLISVEKFPEDRVFTIPNGIDTRRFVPDPAMRPWLREQLQIPFDKPIIGIVAALRPEKNHLQFVEASQRVSNEFPCAHFVIVGEGPERERIQAAINQSGREGQFHLLGSRQDTPHILAGMDVFCLTSRNEANPVSILEALSCGIPVVSPNVGSIPQTVIPDKTGILTEPLSAEDTARGICQLLSKPEVSAELGRNGRQMVEVHWSLQAMVDGYQRLVERLYNLKAARSGTTGWIPNATSIRSNIASEAVSSPLRTHH